MRNSAKSILAATAVSALLLAAGGQGTALAAHTEEHATIIDQGKEIAFDRRKGNCLACHAIPGGVSPGNIGPPLIVMNKRFPSKEKLREQIWDPSQNNPDTMMPPFGRHMIISEDEIDKIVEFIWSL
ncbi:sulfur oxidation c-type cytochrome SoxX [Thioalbus denitrificans]|uniref:Monoheme cytochrome SoxX (Sulfur oxidation) n=1 Tax=Thioalbus denitrificans TaxID=547122 RepID=A0A369C814_9GAMM|nr:sulfur oxidation c-type cytochrome SoxX [Thioalbus denitrificans]RCX29893.1 monoheme cytochrome SoxX (sulfur oxidation) [Thioalbus denitrificans]